MNKIFNCLSGTVQPTRKNSPICCRNEILCVLCLQYREELYMPTKHKRGFSAFLCRNLYKEEEKYGGKKTSPGLILKNI